MNWDGYSKHTQPPNLKSIEHPTSKSKLPMEISYQYGSKSFSSSLLRESVWRDIHDLAYLGQYPDWNVLLQKIIRDPGPRKQHCKIPRDYTPTQTTKWEIQTTNVGAQGITQDNDLTQTTSLPSRGSWKGHWHSDRPCRGVPGIRLQDQTTSVPIDVRDTGTTERCPNYQPSGPRHKNPTKYWLRTKPEPYKLWRRSHWPWSPNSPMKPKTINQLFQDPEASTDKRWYPTPETCNNPDKLNKI